MQKVAKQRPDSNIVKYGLTGNLYMKIEIFTNCFFFLNYRQPYIMASITRVRSPFSYFQFLVLGTGFGSDWSLHTFYYYRRGAQWSGG